jgi:hypothetical protein
MTTSWTGTGSGYAITDNLWSSTGSGYAITVSAWSGTGSGYSITMHDNSYAEQGSCEAAGGSWTSASAGNNGASKWKLVAEYGATDKTNMAGNEGDCGTTPNKCTANSHATLLEFVGDYLYIGFDNATHGANIWRTDMNSVVSGDTPAEASFDMVNIPGLDGTATNQKVFSHVTVNESGTDWLIMTTRDGSDSVQIYRTANDQD